MGILSNQPSANIAVRIIAVGGGQRMVGGMSVPSAQTGARPGGGRDT